MQAEQKLHEPTSQSFLSYFHLVLQFWAIIWWKSGEFCDAAWMIISLPPAFSSQAFAVAVPADKTVRWIIAPFALLVFAAHHRIVIWQPSIRQILECLFDVVVFQFDTSLKEKRPEPSISQKSRPDQFNILLSLWLTCSFDTSRYGKSARLSIL